ncbi:MAG TPA: MoaD/ThiS family protein [Candidatus Binataceae bacterium]|nr:MoaD/ThiS family protein [Candidatus Binataceae bacterium]
MMRVLIPSQLRSYTHGASEIAGTGATLEELTRHLDAAFPGIRFRIIDEQDRIRRHIRVFVNGEQANALAVSLAPSDEVQIVGALTGG